MIKRIGIKQFMGIEELTLTLGPGGALVEGKNGAGKTSILSAVRAALDAQGISPSAVRKGATKSEILIDIEELAQHGAKVNAIQVRRTITSAGGGGLKVTDPATGAAFPSPQTFLAGLLGASTLDPLRLFTEKDEAAQRRMILEAIPTSVSYGQILQWVPGLQRKSLAEILGIAPADIAEEFDAPLPGHGLEVIGKVRKVLYTRRTEANRTTAERASEVARLDKQVKTAQESYRSACAGDGLPGETPVEMTEAMAAVAQAEEALKALDRTRGAAEQDMRRAAKSRERIASLRAEAEQRREKAPQIPSEEMADKQIRAEEAQHQMVAEKAAIVRRLLQQLAEAQALLNEQEAIRDEVLAQGVSFKKLTDAAVDEQEAIEVLLDQATELETALGDPPAVPGPEAFAAAEQAVTTARAQFTRAKSASGVAAAQAVLDQATSAHAQAARVSGVLDAAVKALADDAPAALLATQAGIPGLALDGDDISLDGVALSRLCGEERMRFAITVARRLNAKSKLLIVDGLEAVDEDNLGRFVALATAEGYQLLATRVGRGDTVLRPIGEAQAEGEEASS